MGWIGVIVDSGEGRFGNPVDILGKVQWRLCGRENG